MSPAAERRCYLVSRDLFIPLPEGQAVVLGRDPSACNHVLKDDRVSRVHAMVFHRDNDFFIKDLNSANGTFVNGKRVQGAPLLRTGDRVEVPPFKFEFLRPDYSQNGPVTVGLGAPDSATDKLEGSLSALPLTDLVQLLNVTRQSGILNIVDGIGRGGDLVFTDGEISHANYAGLGGEEAFFTMLHSSREGRFEFTKKEPVGAHPGGGPEQHAHTSRLDAAADAGVRKVFRKTQTLLLEGVRLLDEQRDRRRLAPGPAGSPTRP
jgi:pSer/pThr/pTyr-binding forkhead associated (FHA) protein